MAKKMEKFLKRKNDNDSVTISQKSAEFVHKYNQGYVKYGFVNGGDDSEPNVCLDALSPMRR